MSGILYLCATPIGNLSDMSERLIRTLSEVDIIAAEDTRHTVKLLNHLGIKKPQISYYEHNRYENGVKIINMLKEGKNVALVSDAGTPAISDPGEVLVSQCAEEDIRVVPIPGPVAAVNALIVSALPTGRFSFEGFLPMNKRGRAERLEEIKTDKKTLVFYEAPHKLRRTLADLLSYLGNRRISLCRELTKIHEEIIRTTLENAQSLYSDDNPPKGEFVLVVAPPDENEKTDFWCGWEIAEHVEYYKKQGVSEKDAMKQVAKDRDVPKRDIYDIIKKR